MELLTKEIETQLRANHKANKDGTKSFHPIVKLFNPWGVGTWYLSELDDNDIAYGHCNLGYETELGYVSLDELKNLKCIDRDLHGDGEIKRWGIHIVK